MGFCSAVTKLLMMLLVFSPEARPEKLMGGVDMVFYRPPCAFSLRASCHIALQNRKAGQADACPAVRE